MNLLDIRTNEEYIIEKIEINEKLKNRLLILGIVKGTKVKVLNKKINNDVIIKIRGTRLGISKKIAESIDVKEEDRLNKHAKDKYCFNRKP